MGGDSDGDDVTIGDGDDVTIGDRRFSLSFRFWRKRCQTFSVATS